MIWVLLFALVVPRALLARPSPGGTLTPAKCVSTAQDFADAFNLRAPRCVSDQLVGRIDSGYSVEEALSLNFELRVASFFSGQDVLEKYLRMGYPEELGWSTIRNADGLDGTSNGMAMLLQVGFPLEYIDVEKVYILSVLEGEALRRALKAAEDSLPYPGGISPVAPTWDNLRHFYEYTFEEEGLKLSSEAVNILTNTSFAELTGCQPSCAFTANGFPSNNATTPIFTADRLPDGSCPQPANPTDQPARPTGIDAWSELCSDQWQAAVNTTNGLFAEGCTVDQNKIAGADLAKLMEEAKDDPISQALLFRSFLLHGCSGSFNPLFSGDGFTWTGLGSILAPLGTEFITSGFDQTVLEDDPGVVHIPFCLSGSNGGRPNAEGKCDVPTSI